MKQLQRLSQTTCSPLPPGYSLDTCLVFTRMFTTKRNGTVSAFFVEAAKTASSGVLDIHEIIDSHKHESFAKLPEAPGTLQFTWALAD